MVDFGTALSVAQTLFAALECSLLKEACSRSNYESELERLKTTVTTVKSVLVDAGKKAKLSETDLNYIHKLKDALYDADDLFDKFLTIAARKQNDSLSDKVRLFFSSQNPFKVAHSLFRDVKKIRDLLDAIADDHTKFGFSVDTQPLRRRREETCSYVYANDVIGRDGDATTIINRLLDPTDDVGFLTIVGIGGLGKTTLAKLVYGDKRIESDFPLRLWVCVADQEGKRFDVKEILSKMLELLGCQVDSNSTIEKVQTEYQNKIRGNKILLVLDDMWTENVLEWRKLREFLVIGGKGSRIIVTTRSKETAKIVGNGIDTNTHELQGLSEEDSWCLFEMTAFEKGSIHPKFVEIGKKILKKCYHLPLAIKVVGSLLYDHSIDRWQEFEINGFTGIPNGENEVISILKFSYDHLHPSLKNCFTYCAIFPKDFVIEKEMLLSLWEAQGYIVPFDKGQSIVKAGEEYFSILVKRCFFHDIKKNDYGDVVSFKIHDLMHDLAQRVSESEISIIKSSMLSLKSSTRHVFETEVNVYETNCFVNSKIRSYLKDDRGNFTSISMGKILKNWVCLRALSLKYLKIRSLPDTIGSLIHLRYLNLAESSIKTLPNSIVTLHNLRTLNLNKCTALLEELPKKFSKLVNLTHLYIDESGLKYMPVGMSKLSGLQVLNAFVIMDERRSSGQRVGQLRDLKALAPNLKGSIHILFPEQFTCVVGYDWEESCLVDAEHLKEVQISFPLVAIHDNYKEETLRKLQPHSNLRKFKLDHYDKETIKCWGTAQDNWATILPNLVRIELNNCRELQQLPLLSELLHLKHLVLDSLSSLKYMEEVKSIKGLGSSRSSELTFFPSLESLEIQFCGKLKGWWRDGNSSTCWQPAFPRLSRLSLCSCKELTSFPACPSLHTLKMSFNNRALRITTDKGQSSPSYPLLSSDEKSGSNQDFVNTNGGRFEVDHIDHLKLFASHLLPEIRICLSKMESLSEVEETFQSFSSLNSLEIFFCSKLTSLRGGLDHLTALKSLTLKTCGVLKLEEGEPDDNNDMPWRALQNNLRSLTLYDLPKVEVLPKGMQYLTSLQDLQIASCDNLKEIPEWVGCLQSLQSLRIWKCDAITSLPDAMAKLTSLQQLDILHCHRELIERCTEPNGQDWPKIKHIPLIR